MKKFLFNGDLKVSAIVEAESESQAQKALTERLTKLADALSQKDSNLSFSAPQYLIGMSMPGEKKQESDELPDF